MFKTLLLVLTLASLSSATYWYPTGRTVAATYPVPTASVTAAQQGGNYGYYVSQYHPTYMVPHRPAAVSSHYTAPNYPTAYQAINPYYYTPGYGYAFSSY